MADARDLNADGHVSTVETIASLLASKTVWGVILMLLGFTAPQLAATLGANLDGLTEALGNVITGVGTVLAMWGRLTAKGPIVTAPAAPAAK